MRKCVRGEEGAVCDEYTASIAFLEERCRNNIKPLLAAWEGVRVRVGITVRGQRKLGRGGGGSGRGVGGKYARVYE